MSGDGEKKSSGQLIADIAKPLLVALVPSVFGYFAIQNHAQHMKEQEVQLNVERFRAEQIKHYLSLPASDLKTRRAMAKYLQASFYSTGDKNLHRWATDQIDVIRAEVDGRRAGLAPKKQALKEAEDRLEKLRKKWAELESKHWGADAEARKDLAVDLKTLGGRIKDLEAQIKQQRQTLREDTRQTIFEAARLLSSIRPTVGYNRFGAFDDDSETKPPLEIEEGD